MLVPLPLDPQSKAVVGPQTCPPCFSSGFSEPFYCLPRYKDNPFSLGESFGSRWDTDATWGVERMEEKEPEVTISSIRPISERWSGLGQYYAVDLAVTTEVFPVCTVWCGSH